MISLDEFVNKWNGRGVDVDGFPPDQPFQCYDAFIQYNRECLNLQPTIICQWSGYVKDFWEHFNETILPEYYTQIPWDSQGQKGDVCIWGNAPATPYSHIAILLHDNGSSQHIFGQNQPYPYCTEIDFTSNGLLGYLRPKEVNVPSITSLSEQRILSWGIAGRNGYYGVPNALTGECDDDLKGHIGEESNTAISSWYNSLEGQNWIHTRLPEIMDKARKYDNQPIANPTPPVVPPDVPPIETPVDDNNQFITWLKGVFENISNWLTSWKGKK